MEEVEVPSYFLCPISLQMMRDPVTLLTGITYDRESIDRWLISSGKHSATCPVTNQPLPTFHLTPNHTLGRLIQAWCIANAANGVKPIPTPHPPVYAADISMLLDEARSPPARLACLRKLKEMASGSEADRSCMEASGAVEFLAFVIEDGAADESTNRTACDEAISILSSLQISKQRFLGLITSNGCCGRFMDSVMTILQRSSCYQSRANAVLLLRLVVSVASPSRLVNFSEEQLHEVVNILSDRISNQATKAALHVLLGLCLWGRNRMKAVKAGAVPVLVQLLLEDNDKRVCEMALVLLDKICRCAEGRAELITHPAGVAVVSKKVLRVPPAASDRAVRVLHKVSKFSATPALLQEMLQVGAVSKLCLVLQVDCGAKEKERAREILSLHARVWKNSRCLSPQFLIPLHGQR